MRRPLIGSLRRYKISTFTFLWYPSVIPSLRGNRHILTISSINAKMRKSAFKLFFLLILLRANCNCVQDTIACLKHSSMHGNGESYVFISRQARLDSSPYTSNLSKASKVISCNQTRKQFLKYETESLRTDLIDCISDNNHFVLCR